MEVIKKAMSLEETSISESDWEKLLSVAKISKYSAGDVIIKQGSYNRLFYRIKEGQVKIQKAITVKNLQ